MNRYRAGARRLISSFILLAVGCASDPAARLADQAPTGTPSLVYTSIDEAAVAALSNARARVHAASRQSIQVGTIRKVAGGYIASRPEVADSGIQSSPPSVVRVLLAADDVAIYVVHPASGDSSVDRANETLNGSEKKLLGAGRSRPRRVYLLTPSLEVVRHESEGTPQRLTKLGLPYRMTKEGIRTAGRE